jgi:hypothetical protein
MATKVSEPTTGIGTSVSVVVPVPSWPVPFPPQQHPSPVLVTPQVCCTPASMVENTRPPLTGKGEKLW